MNNINDLKNSQRPEIAFKGMQQQKEIKRTFEEIIKILVNNTTRFAALLTEKEVPRNGKFSPVSFSFNINETSNVGRFCTEYSAKNPEIERYLSLGVRHKNSDRLTSVYLTKGTKEEIISYLKDENNRPEIEKILAELSKKTDDYFNTL